MRAQTIRPGIPAAFVDELLERAWDQLRADLPQELQDLAWNICFLEFYRRARPDPDTEQAVTEVVVETLRMLF